MAKRRKEKDEDEDKPFKLPKFDEEAFLKRERRNIKTTFIAFLFQAATGFGMYSAMSHSWLANPFAWVVPVMGGDFAVRQWHHVMMWFFIIFAIIHVYLVFYHDYVEGRGTISSMAGGWKFVEKE